MEKWLNKALIRLAVVLTLLAPAAPARAQETTPPAGTLAITGVDAALFPTVDVYLAAGDASAARLPSLPADAFRLLENDVPVQGLAVADAVAGVQLIVVLDSGPSFKARDANGTSRLERVKQALGAYFQPESGWKDGVDDVSLVTPEGVLAAHASSATELSAALGGYATEYAGAADPFPLINQALDLASDAPPRPGMRRHVLLFSGGISLSQGGVVDDLAVRAAAGQASIHTVYVGPEGSENIAGAVNLRELSARAGGQAVAFSQPDALAPIFARLADERSVVRVSYRSRLAVTGQHRLSAQLILPGGLELTSPQVFFPLRVEPPQVVLGGLPEQVVPGAGEGMAVNFSVTFPDGHERRLQLAELVVDGQRVALADLPAAAGTLIWPLGDEAGGGMRILQVRVTDELDLLAQSEASTVTVALMPASLGPAVPAPTLAEARSTLPASGLLVPAMVGLLGVLALVGAGGWWWTRRRPRPQTGEAAPGPARAALSQTRPFRPEQHRSFLPAGVHLPQMRLPARTPSRPQGRAYLVVVEAGGGGLPRENIELFEAPVRLGREPDQVDVVFADSSVSRRHARIECGADGKFWLFDEASTSGTWVNLVQIPAEGSWELKSGDLVNLGRVQLRFERRGEASKPSDRQVRVVKEAAGEDAAQLAPTASAAAEQGQPGCAAPSVVPVSGGIGLAAGAQAASQPAPLEQLAAAGSVIAPEFQIAARELPPAAAVPAVAEPDRPAPDRSAAESVERKPPAPTSECAAAAPPVSPPDRKPG